MHEIADEVVICFQICIFVLGDTPFGRWQEFRLWLWFAFKFVFLYWVIHPYRNAVFAVIRCDLLSNLYFCIGWYTIKIVSPSKPCVVICFQICIFVLGDTPYAFNFFAINWLWFAFKFVFLYWVIHRWPFLLSNTLCCDLLSNLYFCIGWYTAAPMSRPRHCVVICFQICIFVLGDTPDRYPDWLYLALWFAFKFVFLYWVIHLKYANITKCKSCDLLSNLYFCIGWYTKFILDSPLLNRCDLLSNLYFCIGWYTTCVSFSTRNVGCDLLSNLYFCIGWYTIKFIYDNLKAVVICFQICIFVLGDTPAW